MQNASHRQPKVTRKVMTVCLAIAAVLFTGWLFGFSGWIPGRDAAKARGLRAKIAAQIPPGTSRADAEAFLTRAGIEYHYSSRGDPSFSAYIDGAEQRAGVSVARIHGFTDSSLDTKFALVPDRGERVFLRLLFDQNEKMLGYEWYAFAPGI